MSKRMWNVNVRSKRGDDVDGNISKRDKEGYMMMHVMSNVAGGNGSMRDILQST